MMNQEDNELEKLRKRKMLQMTDQSTDDGTNDKKNINSFPDSPVPVTDANFKEFIAGYPIVLVDCWAPWCGPCRALGPVIEELAKDYQGKVTFGKLDVDRNPRTAGKYQTMSIPTMLIFKNGKLVDRIVGALPRQMIEGKLQQHLAR